MTFPDDWTALGHGLYRREYASNEEYVKHQGSKLDGKYRDGIERTDKALEGALRFRIPAAPDHTGLVLCLGARLGGECRAFKSRGWSAIGIDLNPGYANVDVIEGDMHAIPAVDDYFQAVYCNCLDHVRDFDLVMFEVRRVLEPGGLFIVEAIGPKPDGRPRLPQAWECFWWDEPGCLFKAIALSGFRLESREPIDEPWRGEQARFRLSP